jgi:hypothetical protein
MDRNRTNYINSDFNTCLAFFVTQDTSSFVMDFKKSGGNDYKVRNDTKAFEKSLNYFLLFY